MMRYRLERRARADIRMAEEHYRGESDDLSRAFATVLRETLDLITTYPQSSPADPHGIRRKPLRGFPYVFIYHIEDEVITILALMHQRRMPDAWRDRA